MRVSAFNGPFTLGLNTSDIDKMDCARLCFSSQDETATLNLVYQSWRSSDANSYTFLEKS